MVMKDKLIKFNHKASYYKLRKCLFVFLAFICVGSAIAIPTYMSFSLKAPEAGHAIETSENNETESEGEILSVENE